MDFSKLKNQIIDCLNTLEVIGLDLGSEGQVKFVRAGIEKLKQNKFTVVIAGEFSRGKTTFLKALTGGLEFLPDANQANTAVITSVEYSEDEELLHQFKVIYRDDREDEMLHKDEIRRFVEQDPTVRQVEIDKIERICLWSNLPYLKEGIQIVDSPGLGSVYPHHREITYEQIAESDACIFLMLIRPAAGASEISFLKDIQKYLNKVFFIINQCDMDNLLKKPDVLNTEIDKIVAQLNTQDINEFSQDHLFSISSQWAFAGKAKENANSILQQRGLESWDDYFKSVEIEDFDSLYALSGFSSFEKFFEDFIYNGQRAKEILMAPIKRIHHSTQEFKEHIDLRLITLNDDMSVEELSEKIELIKEKLSLFRDKSEGSLKDTQIKFEDLIKRSEQESERQFDRARSKIKSEIKQRTKSFDTIDKNVTQESVDAKVTREINKVIDNLIDLIQVGIDDLIVTQQRKDQAELSDLLDQIESDFSIKIPKIELPKVYFNESALAEYDRRILMHKKDKERLEKDNEKAKEEELEAREEFEEKDQEAIEMGKAVRRSEDEIKDLKDEKPIFKQGHRRVIIDTIEEPYNHTYIEEKKWGLRFKFWPHKKQRTETRIREVPVYGPEYFDNTDEIEAFNKKIREEKKNLRSYKEQLSDILKNVNTHKEKLKLKEEYRDKIAAAQNKVDAKIQGLEDQKRRKMAELKEEEIRRFMDESEEIIDDLIKRQINFGRREIRRNVRKYYEVFKEGINTEYDNQISNLENELNKLLADKDLKEGERTSLIEFLSGKLKEIQSLQQKVESIEANILDHKAVV